MHAAVLAAAAMSGGQIPLNTGIITRASWKGYIPMPHITRSQAIKNKMARVRLSK